jgi:hypothetical protein
LEKAESETGSLRPLGGESDERRRAVMANNSYMRVPVRAIRRFSLSALFLGYRFNDVRTLLPFVTHWVCVIHTLDSPLRVQFLESRLENDVVR